MNPLDVPDIALARRSDRVEAADNRKLAKAVRQGTWIRVTRGSYAPARAWSTLTAIQKHRVRVAEIVRRQEHSVVASHSSAAAFWDIDVLGAWPDRLEVIVPRASGGRSDGRVTRYAWGTDGVRSIQWRINRITTPAQTALDLARTLPFMRAVTAVDQALWHRRRGGALTTKTAILELLESAPRRGDVRARRVIDFATDLSDSVRESQSRVVLFELGFPTPRLQERRVLRSGRVVYGDFYFPEQDHWCEVDGRVKYLDPSVTGGRRASDVVIDEKNRENEIRREVRTFSRWEAADSDHPRRIYDILTAAGLPSTKPRP